MATVTYSGWLAYAPQSVHCVAALAPGHRLVCRAEVKYDGAAAADAYPVSDYIADQEPYFLRLALAELRPPALA